MNEVVVTAEELLSGLMAIGTVGFVLGWMANHRKPKEEPDGA